MKLLSLANVVNAVKMLVVAAVALSAVGCANVGALSQKNLDKGDAQSREIIGVVGYLTSASETALETSAKACAGIKNADARCLEQDKYRAVVIMSKFGLSDAGVGYVALIPNSLNIKPCLSGGKGGTYVRATKKKGELATVTEIVSRPGDGKCHWSGWNSAGGVVCDGLYDYRKDFRGYILR
ncbi:MAG: hypothetical protein WBP13_02515 [Methylophilaceae bacterium]